MRLRIKCRWRMKSVAWRLKVTKICPSASQGSRNRGTPGRCCFSRAGGDGAPSPGDAESASSPSSPFAHSTLQVQTTRCLRAAVSHWPPNMEPPRYKRERHPPSVVSIPLFTISMTHFAGAVLSLRTTKNMTTTIPDFRTLVT